MYCLIAKDMSRFWLTILFRKDCVPVLSTALVCFLLMKIAERP